MKVIVLAVGRLRPPFADDVSHYERLLSRHAQARDRSRFARTSTSLGGFPERAFVSLLDAEGEQMDSLGFSRFLEQRRQEGRDLCFVLGGPFGHTSTMGASITGCRSAR